MHRDITASGFLSAGILLGILLAGAPSVAAQPAEIVDRMVGVVNGKVITLSDLQEAMRVRPESALSGKESPGGPTEEDLRLYMERLLIRQEIRNYPGMEVSAEEVQAQLDRLAPAAGQPGIFRDPQEREKIGAELKEQLLYEKFIDLRFRQFIEISAAEIEKYYRETFPAELKQAGIPDVPPLAEVRDRIQRILEEDRIHQQLEQWIEELRQKAEILVFPEKLRFVPEAQERRFTVPAENRAEPPPAP